MSKMNSKKNNKSVKSSKKSRNNFKIESLEPRLLMDAAVDWNDLEQLKLGLDQTVSSIGASLSSKITAESNKMNALPVSFTDSASHSISKAEDLLAGVKNNVTTQLKTAFEGAFNQLISERDGVLNAGKDLSSLSELSFNSFVENYVIGELQTNSGISLSVVPNKQGKNILAVSYDFKSPVSLQGLDLNVLGLEIKKQSLAKDLNISAQLSIEVDLDVDNDGKILENTSDTNVDSFNVTYMKAFIENVGVGAKYMNVEVFEEDNSTSDVVLEYSPSTGFTTDLNLEFKIVTNTTNPERNLPFDAGIQTINIVRTTDKTQTPATAETKVEFPNAVTFPTINGTNFSLKNLLSAMFTTGDWANLPYIGDLQLLSYSGYSVTVSKIPELIGLVDEYWARASMAMNGALDNDKLDLKNLSDYFDILLDSKKSSLTSLLNSFELSDGGANSVSLLNNTVLGSTIDLTKTKELVLKIKPKIGHISGKQDFFLFEVDGFDVNLDIEIKIGIHEDGGILVFDSISTNKVDLKLESTLPTTMKLALFDADVSGKLVYDIQYDSSKNEFKNSIAAQCSSIAIKTNSILVTELSVKKDKSTYDIVFNVNDGVWEFPDEIKQYVSFTGDTLATQVVNRLQSLQNTLLSAVREKVKINFIGDSVDKVLNVIDDLNIVIYGGEKNGSAINGLFLLKEGYYKPNFDSVESFVVCLNDAWNKVFNATNVCTLIYNGKVKGTAKQYTYGKDTSFDADYKLDTFALIFNLKFGREFVFDLNLAEALDLEVDRNTEKQKFFNISSHGTVGAEANASIDFSLDVKFCHKSLSKKTELNDFLSDSTYDYSNESYFETVEYEKKLSVRDSSDEAVVNFEIVYENGEIAKAEVKEEASGKFSFHVDTVSGINTKMRCQDGRILVTSNAKFYLQSADGADAYAELKLDSDTFSSMKTNLQTICEVSTSASTKIITLTLKKNGSVKPIYISLDELNDLKNKMIVDGANEVDLMNCFLSLQKSTLEKASTTSTASCVGDGRTLMNTYGVYVVSYDKGTYVFGCDPTRIQDYDGSNFYEFDSTKSAQFGYMRVSGNLNSFGSVGSTNGYLLEQVVEIKNATTGKTEFKYNYCFLESTKGVFCDYASDADAQDAIDSFYKDGSGVKQAEIQGNTFVGCFKFEKVSYKDSSGADKYRIVLVANNSATTTGVTYNVVSSDKFWNIDLGAQNVYVDTANCLDLTHLSRTVNEAFLKNNVTDVSACVIDNKIVFSTKTKSSISLDSTPLKSESCDFIVTNLGTIKSEKVDFEKLHDPKDNTKILVVGMNTSLKDVVAAIESEIVSTGVKFYYHFTDASSNEVYLDHLELRAKDCFAIENFGTSSILSKLGFSAGTASYYGNADYRIVGKPLLSVDWSKLIDFASTSFKANAKIELELSQKVSFDAANAYKNQVTLTITSTCKSAEYEEGGFISNGTSFYKIIKVVKASNNQITSIVINEKAEGDYDDKSAKKFDTTASLTSLRYVASALVTVGFVDVNMILTGKYTISADLSIEKLPDSDAVDESNLFGYKVGVTINDPGAAAPVTNTPFTFGAFVDVGDTFSESIASASVGLDGSCKLEIKAKSGLDDIYKKVIAKYGSFSAEDLFSLLEHISDRLTEGLKKSDVKIPVINKSVKDLVDVASNIRDIIVKMRKDNIYSLQGFSQYFTKYLEDAAFDAYGSSPLFNLEFVGGKVLFNLNLDKKFKTSHSFNFGSGAKGVSGAADLNVTGAFWLSLSAEVKFGSDIDLELTRDLLFGASVNISGDKLSFNLGLDGITDAALLANLITVGSNDANSYVKASFDLECAYGREVKNYKPGSSVYTTNLSLKKFDETDMDITIKARARGKLPISVCGYSLGDIDLGRSNGVNVCDLTDSDAEYLLKFKGSATSKSDFEFKLITGLDGNVYDTGKHPFVIDVSKVYNKIDQLKSGNLAWFDKIKLAVTGLDNLFDTLESKLNSGMMSDLKSVPVVGGALSNGADFLTVLKNKVLDPFSKFVYESTGLTAEMVAQKMNDLFKGSFLKLDADETDEMSGWSRINDAGTFYRSDNNHAEWFFRLGGTYSYGTDIGFDLGFPGLGLETEGGLDLGVKWKLEFGFGVDQSKGFYFILGDGDEISLKAYVGFADGTKVLGKLAGLGMSLDLDSGDCAEVNFGVDLNQGAFTSTDVISTLKTTNKVSLKVDDKNIGAVNLSNLIANKPEFKFNAKAFISAIITVGVLKDVKNADTPKFPNIAGTLLFKWSDKGIEELGFEGLYLDMGSFISGVLNPIVSRIQKVVEPLKPLIDFLTTPFPVLDDLDIIYTPLDLAKQYSKGKFDDGMIKAIKDLITLSEQISSFSTSNKSVKLDLGDFFLTSSIESSLGENGKDFAKGTKSLKDLDIKTYVGTKNVQSEANANLEGNGFHMGKSEWYFFWNDYSKIFQLLLGQDIPLVEYHMPKLSFSFDWSTFIRIYGPLGARLGLSLSASIDLGFGYDTYGIRQWIGSDYKDFGRLLNGFYVCDLRDGVDVNELSFTGGLTAAAELNAGVKAGVGGGVKINVGFNLHDPNKDGKVRLGELSQMVQEEGGLFGIFDINGKITANLYAYVDLLFYSDEWNITGDKTLCDFEFTRKEKAVMASQVGNDVVANIGANSANRIAVDGVNVSLDDGDETLRLYIDDDNKVYDATEKGVKGSKCYGQVKDGGKLIVNAGEGNDKIYVYGNSSGAASCNIEIRGENGNDLIDLSGLNLVAGFAVFVWGDAGSDTIIGANGMNVIFGDGGQRRVDEEKDKNGNVTKRWFVIDGNVNVENAGDDVIIGGSTRDIIVGGAGNDQINGGAGSDIIVGDGGQIAFDVSSIASWAYAKENGKNTKNPDYKTNKLIFTSILGKSIDDAVVTRTDISLDGGDDIVVGDDDDDLLYGGRGNDHIDGSAGNDILYGGKGNDRILGGSGNDFIYGGEGMDIIFGDRINATTGSDVSAQFNFPKDSSNSFSEEFIEAHFKNGGCPVTEDEFKIKVSADNPYKNEIDAVANKGVDSAGEGVDHIYGEDGDDLIFGDSGAKDGAGDFIYGGIGNDIIDGDGGNDTIEGGIDNDIIYGGAGDDVIDGGAGNDRLYGDEGISAYSTTSSGGVLGNTYETDKVVFGENVGIGTYLYKDAKSSLTETGNDKIVTGPGMDFVDGQGGDDIVTFKSLGDSTVNYANITDTGAANEVNVLNYEGTENEDHILMRRNDSVDSNKNHVAGDLGFIANLPITEDDLDENDPIAKANLNSNIERVNFTSAINVVNINANAGNDKIYIDGTAETTNVDGGAGDDTFRIGQLYNSERNTKPKQPGTVDEVSMVSDSDAFITTQTSDEQYISDGVTVGSRLNIDGGIGEDNFIALNNVGQLNLAGGKNNDTFSVYTFRDKDGDALERGVLSIDGGKDIDTLNIRGTDGEDTFVVTKEGMLSDLIAIKAAGVENTKFDAAAGDDMFYVVGNNAGETTELNGGKGNDTFSAGGLDATMDLRSANTDGQNCGIDYEVITSDEGLGAEQVAKRDTTAKAGSVRETITVVDTCVPAVFVNAAVDGNGKSRSATDAIIKPNISLSEGKYTSFFICSEGCTLGDEIRVSISAPMVSNNDFMRGDQGVLVGVKNGSDIEWSRSKSVSLTKNAANVEIFVMVVADHLVEEDMVKSISISSTYYAKNGSRVYLSKSVSSVDINLAAEKGFDADCANIISSTKELTLDSSLSVDYGVDLSLAQVYAYSSKDGSGIAITKSGSKITVSSGLQAGDKIIVNVRASEMRLDDSKITLAHDEIKNLKVRIHTVDEKQVDHYYEISSFDAYKDNGSSVYKNVVYKIYGNVIVFYNKITGQQVTIHENVVVTADANASNAVGSGSSGAGSSSSETPILTIAEHPCVLVEKGTGAHNSIQYSIVYNGTIEANKSVFVKVTPQQLPANKKLVENGDLKMFDRLLITCGSQTSATNGYIILEFNAQNSQTCVITVSSIDDKEDDDYGITRVLPSKKVIDDIDGAVYAYGEGASIDMGDDDPAMLSYRHRFEENNKAGSSVVKNAASYNERNDYDMSKLFVIDSLQEKTLKVDLSSLTAGQKTVLKGLLNVDGDFDVSTDEKAKSIAAEFVGKTLKFVNRTWTNSDNQEVKESDANFNKDELSLSVSTSPKWIRIENCSAENGVFTFVLNESCDLSDVGTNFVFYSVSRDALFVDENELVDRLFVNNQDYMGVNEKTSSLNAINISNAAERAVAQYDRFAVRFNHTDIGTAGIVAAQMEYGEYNLGSSKDKVSINKTLYREDGFRTYTVVNTGDQNTASKTEETTYGPFNINNEKAKTFKDGLYHYNVLASAGNNNVNVTLDPTVDVYYVDAVIQKMDENDNPYVVGVQRRKIEKDFSILEGFDIKYDFILAEGEFISSFTFIQAEFDDEISVNNYIKEMCWEIVNDGVVCAAPVATKSDELGEVEDSGDLNDVECLDESENDTDDTAGNVTGITYYYTSSVSQSSFDDSYKEYNKIVDYFKTYDGVYPKIYAEAKMSDGSTQRREVVSVTYSSFVVLRDFTTSENVSVESLKIIVVINGDGQLVINAQGGNDKIDASNDNVTRNDMVVVGGLGDDFIDMKMGGIAIGDRGQVRVENYDHKTGDRLEDTILGSTDGGSDYTTGINKKYTVDDDKNNLPMYRLQTDGVNRGAYKIHSMNHAEGGVDIINVGGTDSTVIGGAMGDVIAVGGDNNNVLGDNGSVQNKNVDNTMAVYGDNQDLGLHIVKTEEDAIGNVDSIVITGNDNVAMGGYENDRIHIAGNNNIVVGDGGIYRTEDEYQVVETTSDKIGGKDFITTGDGSNVVMGGTDADRIITGNGNDVLVGDGGLVITDAKRNVMFVTNEHRNTDVLDKDEKIYYHDDDSAGADHITTSGGDNVILGGLKSDIIESGDGQDSVLGDNGYATFRGNADINKRFGDFDLDDKNFKFENTPEIQTESTLSFNFQGAAQQGLNSEEKAGAANAVVENEAVDYSAKNWNNIAGSLSGTYGNDDKELVYFDDGTRASAVSVCYGGHEIHRYTATDKSINLQAYTLGLNGVESDTNKKLMNSGLMTSAPGNQCDNRLDVTVDGLAQYFVSYDVIVYLDVPDSHSAQYQSVRKVSLYIDGVEVDAYYVNDMEEYNYGEKNGNPGLIQATTWAYKEVGSGESKTRKAVELDDVSVKDVTYGNYVVFRVASASDRIEIRITDGYTEDSINGKDLPGIAGIQIKGQLHKQDIVVSSDLNLGGDDNLRTKGGDDVVVGGTGSDTIVTYGDERYGLYDNDVVFGDNVKLTYVDRDNDKDTATTLSRAESIAATDMAKTYDDVISTGDGNDVVVGGIGADKIFSGDVKKVTVNGVEYVEPNHTNERKTDSELDNLKTIGFNFTGMDVGSAGRHVEGEAAGVVETANWHNVYRNDRGFIVTEDNVPVKPEYPTYPEWTGSRDTYEIAVSDYYARLDEYTVKLQKYNEAMEIYSQDMNNLGQDKSRPNKYSVVDGVGIDLYALENGSVASTAAMKILDDQSLDGDTTNSKLFNSYLAAQQSDELILKLTGLSTYRGNDNASCDVYIYIGGDDKDSTGSYNYVYQIWSEARDGYAGETRYLNDWRGNNFEGDYREADCMDADVVADTLRNGISPDIRLIGNYVVLRNVTCNDLTVHLRSLYVQGSQQSPKHLPVISAVQIVANKTTSVSKEIAIGGDHDKDLVFGDDAYLEFDLDIPFAVNEDISEYKNRVITAKSKDISLADAQKIDTHDVIVTGKDRDVVVGGEGADVIRSGAADDVVLGDNAELKLEHNNPIGVFTPSVENTLEEHDYKQSNEKYLGADNVTVQDIENKYNQGLWNPQNNNGITGIKDTSKDETGRKDDIVDTEGSNLLIEGKYGDGELLKPVVTITPVPEVQQGEGQQGGTQEGETQQGEGQQGETSGGATDSDGKFANAVPETLSRETGYFTVEAGDVIKFICTDYPKAQGHKPNLVVYGNSYGAGKTPELDWFWDGDLIQQTCADYAIRVDIPDDPNGENDAVVIYVVAKTSGIFSVYMNEG